MNQVDRTLLDKAFLTYMEICQRKGEIAKNCIELGRLLKDIREKEYYKVLDYETFAAFCGAPEISLSRSTVYGLIHLYELYVERLGVNQELLAQIGHAKLQTISTVVEQSPEEWLYKAKELSRSDLIDEVRGKETRPSRPKKEIKPEPVDPLVFESYLLYVKAHPCVVCNSNDVDAHHFPLTKGAGAMDEWVIPLCRRCHIEYHDNPKGFLWVNKARIFRYFYDLVLELFKKKFKDIGVEGNA